MDELTPPKVNSETRQLCSKLADEVVRPLVTQKEFIYIDASFFLDFKVGALLSLIRREKIDYDYILQHLQEYLDAPTLECTKFFPKLNLTEQDLLDRMEAPEYNDVLSVITPPTKFLSEFGNIIRVLNTINQSKESSRPLKVTINQNLMTLNQYVRNNLTNAIHMIDSEIKVTFTEYRSWSEVPESVLEKQDVICVYNLRDFLREGTTSQKMLAETNKLSMTDIMAITQSDSSKEDLKLGLDNLKSVMEMMCDKFTFIHKTLLTSKDISHG